LPKNGYLRYDDMAEKLPENDLLTQTEVAKYLRVVDATVKNYREEGF
jgi:predicted transcriptional regulator